ncbi:TetR/AcrR family transcriptional regulator [Microbispora cellulosiformans]|uniref:TetR/AcrR family transcriptional regulator n=1 Tax=Microbispora cellulosiformans TaxID=2614688 RepID=A0A5J5JVP9_9ACTN|nr:TetR/AcrR family transcriptional regulator [Microbispora cellulosiformans]KAA9374210.1 TetR/AcrR family transcriptional regulator [Microbispora cellulosiformans]
MEREAGSRRSPAKRKAIVQAALELFLAEGYARVSMDAIAARAGVGKQTVYSHFGNKERLFLAVVGEARTAASATPDGSAESIGHTGDPRTDLQAVGERLLRVVLSPAVAALHRLTVAELTHQPELQQSWRETSSDAILEEVANYLAAADRAGTLEVPDPLLAARQFVLLVATEGRVRTLHGTQPLADAERQQVARETAELIIRAHRPSGC